MVEKRENVARHYDQVELQKGPPIYTKRGLYDAMFELGEFSYDEAPYEILDAMCGAGLVGKEIAKRLKEACIEHTMTYLDVAEKKLKELADAGNRTVLAPVEEVPVYFDPKSLHRVYSRFGIKNYPWPMQVEIFNWFRFVLRQDGIFVMCDMESPAEAYEFMQAERREKHKYTKLEGSEPHIPTREMWMKMLQEAGFVPRRVSTDVSRVTTTDWVNSNQMSAEDLAKMNAFLMAAPEHAKRALNIRQEGEAVKIDYPVVVMSASPK
jgi:ubiquinone/menaquinone biosynthesis C-methylase UbiE